MRVTLEFDDEDVIEARHAFNGGRAHSALWNIVQYLRGKAKNSDTIDAETTYQEVFDIIREFNINMDE